MLLPPPGLQAPAHLPEAADSEPKLSAPQSIVSSPRLNEADAAAGEGHNDASRDSPGAAGRASARTRARADLRAKARARRREAAAAAAKGSTQEAGDQRSEDGISEKAESLDGLKAALPSGQQNSDEISALRQELAAALSLCEAQKHEIAVLKSQNSFLLTEYQAAKECKQAAYVSKQGQFAAEHHEERYCILKSELHMGRADLQAREEGRTFADNGCMIQGYVQPLVLQGGHMQRSLVSSMPSPPSTPPPLLQALSEQTPSPSSQPFPLRLAEFCDPLCDVTRLPLPVKVPLRSLETLRDTALPGSVTTSML